MKKFIGLDIHSATFTMVVLNEKGKVERQCRKATTEKLLMQEVGSIVGDKDLMLEVGYRFAGTEHGVCNGNFLGIGADASVDRRQECWEPIGHSGA